MEGGYISIALVYEDKIKSSNELEKLIKYFLENGATLLNIKYCEDEEGTRWKEEIVENNKIDFTLLTEKYYGSISIKTELLNKNSINVNMSIHKEKDYYGFLMDMKWQDLFEEHSKGLVEEISVNLVNFLRQIYKMTQYSYSFCGQEIEIEYPPRDFNDVVNEYPIAIIPFENGLDVFYGELGIDGVSFQNKLKQTYLID